MSVTKSENLNPTLTLWGGTILAINMVVGAGVFSLAGLAIEMVGPSASILSWLLTSAAISPFLFIFYDLTKRYGHKGSLVQYASDAVGEWSSHTVSLLMLGVQVLMIPVIAMAGAAYLQRILNLNSAGWTTGFSILILVAGTVINLMGVKVLTWVNRISFWTLSAIVLLLVLFHLKLAAFGVTETFRSLRLGFPTMGEIGRVSTLLFLALIGWENLSFGVSEIKRVESVLPKIYFLSYFLVVSVYLSLAFVVAGAYYRHGNVSGITGLVPLIQQLPLGNALLIGTLLVILGNSSSWIYGASRMLYSSSQNEIFTPLLSHLNRKKVPYISLAYIMGLCGIVLFMVGRFSFSLSSMVQLANQNVLVIYFLCLLNYWLVKRGPMRWLVSVPALLSCGILGSGLSWHFVYPLILIAIGVISSRPHKASSSTVIAAV